MPNSAFLDDLTSTSTRELDRCSMAATQAITACSKTECGSSKQRPSHDNQRDSLDCQNRGTVARFARAIWRMGNGIWAVLPLATQRDLGSDSPTIAAASRCGRQIELGRASCRWQCDSRPPTRGGCKKGELDPESSLREIEQVQQREALGRSKGGFSTKIHLRCDANGLPITFVLTVGERHETVMFEQLMEQGAVKRTTSGRPRVRVEWSAIKATAAEPFAATCVVAAFALRSRAKTMRNSEVSLTSRFTAPEMLLSVVSTD